MKVGIGLPGASRGRAARASSSSPARAEAQGFSSLGTIDRIVYGNWEPLVALAAAAVVTERIELMTTVCSAAPPQRRPDGQAGAQRHDL